MLVITNHSTCSYKSCWNLRTKKIDTVNSLSTIGSLLNSWLNNIPLAELFCKNQIEFNNTEIQEEVIGNTQRINNSKSFCENQILSAFVYPYYEICNQKFFLS